MCDTCLVPQVAIPTAGKTNKTSGIATNHYPSQTPDSAFAEAANQPSASSTTTTSASAQTAQQQQGAQPTALPVTASLHPYTLIPGFASRPHSLDTVHPLPSEPVARAVPLQDSGPSPGAWEPQQAPVQSNTPHTLDVSADEPPQTDLWADLAAELRSAPISVPAQVPQAPAGAHTIKIRHSPTNPAQLPQQETSQHEAPTLHADSTAHEYLADCDTAVLKPKRHARRKLAVMGALTAAAAEESSQSTTHEQTPSQPNTQTRAGASAKSRAPRRAAAKALNPAPQAACSIDAEECTLEDGEAASRADPTRQAKNAAFKGSGALGLSRRLSSRLLTPQEVSVMAKLPLPPALQRLEEVLFPPVNAMYGFLLRQHIQVSPCAGLSAAFFCYCFGQYSCVKGWLSPGPSPP